MKKAVITLLAATIAAVSCKPADKPAAEPQQVATASQAEQCEALNGTQLGNGRVTSTEYMEQGDELISLAKRIWQKYAALPSTEFWSEETTNITLRQIEFTYDCGFFADPGDARTLLDQYSAMLANVRKWATAGIKNSTGEKFKLYKNEIMIADNTIFFKIRFAVFFIKDLFLISKQYVRPIK